MSFRFGLLDEHSLISDVNIDRSSNVAVRWTQLLLPVRDLRRNKTVVTFLITSGNRGLIQKAIRIFSFMESEGSLGVNKSEFLNLVQSLSKREHILFL
jgi:hypothetical protein